MSSRISPDIIEELVRIKSDGLLYHRESKDLEFKKQFNFSELAEYYRDFAAFANNAGGYLIFGVSDRPRKIIGLSEKSASYFDKIDPAKIAGDLLDIFSEDIQWEQVTHEVDGLKLGVVYVHMSQHKPIMAKKNHGGSQEIRTGEIYFRYAGRTQKIQYSELSYIIEQRIQRNTDQLLSLIKKLSIVGPANAAILDTDKGFIQKDDKHILVIDENIVKKIKFIREGHFDEREGAISLRLVGDVQAMNAVEVTKTISKRLIDLYPFSFLALYEEIKKRLPEISRTAVCNVIKDNDIKNNPQYSAYNYRTKQHADKYAETGTFPSNTPSIYNKDAIEFIINVLKE